MGKTLSFILIAILALMIFGNKTISQKSVLVPLAKDNYETKGFPSVSESPKAAHQRNPAQSELVDSNEQPENIDSEILDDTDLVATDRDTIVSQCQNGNWKACEKLSHSCYERNFEDCFELGKKFSEIDQKRAIPYYRTTCEQTRHPESCLHLALALVEVKADVPLEKILRYLHVACVEGGISMACLEMLEVNPNSEDKIFYQAQAQKLISKSGL
ncbi:MAG: hypothetical protein A4S09_16100 [Proteobacteria bacterium SG_bin7]|nr:MAG: hypothetical protein A4S09_16100 [Proteobacteria bacterium SG_bin7]